MRGVVSNGMLCSGRELRLSEDQGGILVLGRDDGPAGVQFSAGPDRGLELGLPLADYLGAAFGPDVVFDLAIEGNRPDCLCVAGMARDIAARLGLPLQLPEPVVEHGPDPAASYTSVEVLAPELCHRLIGKVLVGVTNVASPAVIGSPADARGDAADRLPSSTRRTTSCWSSVSRRIPTTSTASGATGSG